MNTLLTITLILLVAWYLLGDEKAGTVKRWERLKNTK